MAKFCVNCGKQLDEAAKFCASCGAQQPLPLQQAQPQAQPQYQQTYAYAPAPIKSQTPLIVGCIVGAIALVLIVALIAINVSDPFGSGGVMPKRELSATERELVGVWAHGSVDLGFWTQYDQGAYSIEEYRPSSGAGGIVYTFNEDGTYSKHSWVNSTSVGQTSSLETGNWAVIEANTIQFSNKFVVYYEDFKNPGNSYKNRDWEERWGGYILYYVRSDSIEFGYEGFFFHDSDLSFIQQRAADGNYSMEYYRKRN